MRARASIQWGPVENRGPSIHALVGRRIREECNARRLTQGQLAAAAAIETSHLSRIENNQGDFLSRSLKRQSSADSFRHFSTARFQGETVIIVEIYSRAAKGLRSYRASATGVLGAAAATTKPNGSYHVVTVPGSEAAAGFAGELEFWTQYYRDHLKP